MDKVAIICIDDEREVLDAVTRDLARFRTHFRIEPAESAADAREVVDELMEDGWKIGLVLADHLMPGTNGVDFLIALEADPATKPTRKVLVTAQAGLEDTIRAVNRGRLDHYIRKPWKLEDLHAVVIRFLSDFVVENCTNPTRYIGILDGARILRGMNERGGIPPA